jgi:hypothetical protein
LLEKSQSSALMPVSLPSQHEHALVYLNDALDIIQQHSFKGQTIDWAGFRVAVLTETGSVDTVADAYRGIRMALSRLGDGHSFFLEPGEHSNRMAGSLPRASEIVGQCLVGPIGYVRVPSFAASEQVETARFAKAIEATISGIDRSDMVGWIVDLRDNHGGDMWPMLAGLGPLLGDGELGAFVRPDGTRHTWFYSNGSAGCDDEPIASIGGNPYRLRVVDPPVALLIGAGTASSGEAVTIAFRGRPRTRSFGSPTFGQTTANMTIELTDGAILLLAVSVESDRTGQQFSSSISPDVLVEGGTGAISPDDIVVRAASAWLLAGA